MSRGPHMKAIALVMAGICAFAPLVSFSLSSNCQCSKDSPCSSDGYICLCCANYFLKKGPQGAGDSGFPSNPDDRHLERASHASDAGPSHSSMRPPVPCYAEIGQCGSTLDIMSQMLPPAAVVRPVFVQEGPGPLLAIIAPSDDSAHPGYRIPEDPPPTAAPMQAVS